MAATNGHHWSAPNLATVAKFFGVADTTVKNDWRRDGMPGRAKRWNLSKIAQWRLRRIAEHRPLVAEDQLARFRKLRADILELDKEQRRKTLVPMHELQPKLMRLAALIKQLGEELGRAYGEDAVEMVRDTLDAFELELEASGDT